MPHSGKTQCSHYSPPHRLGSAPSGRVSTMLKHVVFAVLALSLGAATVAAPISLLPADCTTTLPTSAISPDTCYKATISYTEQDYVFTLTQDMYNAVAAAAGEPPQSASVGLRVLFWGQDRTKWVRGCSCVHVAACASLPGVCRVLAAMVVANKPHTHSHRGVVCSPGQRHHGPA